MKSRLIFIIEKDPVIRGLLKYNLKISRSGDIFDFQSDEDCLHFLKKPVFPDYLIAGSSSHRSTATDILDLIRRISPQTRVIFFDKFTDATEATSLLEAGAFDCIMQTRDPRTGINELLKNLQYILNEEKHAALL